MRVPPPSPIDKIKGILKLIFTPPIVTAKESYLGNPLVNTPRSFVTPHYHQPDEFYCSQLRFHNISQTLYIKTK